MARERPRDEPELEAGRQNEPGAAGQQQKEAAGQRQSAQRPPPQRLERGAGRS